MLKLIKLKYLLLLLLLNVNTYAQNQDPGDFGNNPNDENPLDNPPSSPIDKYIFILSSIGFIYAYQKLIKKKN